MRISEILNESMPKTLYHGTLKRNVPDIMDRGLIPQVGKFTSHAYDEYLSAGIALDNLVFAADRRGLGKCISAIIGQMRQELPKFHHTHNKITAEEFYQNAAILVFKHAEPRFKHRFSDQFVDHPAHVEPDDYYHTGADLPDIVLTDDRLRSFLRRNGIRLADYGIRDAHADAAEQRRVQAQKTR